MGYLVIADFFGDGGARYAFALSPKLRPLVVPYLPNQYEFHDRRRVIYACSHSVQDRPGSPQGARVLVLPLQGHGLRQVHGPRGLGMAQAGRS
jgi:hypothetical protein